MGLLARYTDVDVVIVEGYKTAGLPNVVVARSGVDRLRGSSSLDLVDDATLAIACNDTLANHIHINPAGLPTLTMRRRSPTWWKVIWPAKGSQKPYTRRQTL